MYFLSRRDFVIAGFAGPALVAVAKATPLKSRTSSRRVFSLNSEWLFGERRETSGTQRKHVEALFKKVTIPHTNCVLPWHGFDSRESQFVSLYQRRLRLPKHFASQRVFINFGGVMTAAKVFLNEDLVGEYRGGYLPFSFELTACLKWGTENVLTVEVDSTERADVPPFGGPLDYLPFGGIYREVSLRVVADTFIENVFAKPIGVLSENRSVMVRSFVNGRRSKGLRLMVELFDGDRILAMKDEVLTAGVRFFDMTLEKLGPIELWDLDHPKLYTVRSGLFAGDRCIDHFETRMAFRDSRFTSKGYFLNGRHLKLRGLNRHQTFPFVGQAMPARVQRRDAWILKKELKCNIVRTSHYPQSPHFLDACDELGLLVFEEIPGWNHIGDAAWKELSLRDVDGMIRRDWNHPSIIMWGVRINESVDDREFYTRTNQLARSLDDSRPTGGVRHRYESERLEDVFTMNDFGFPLKPPSHPLYLNTEFAGHMYPTKRFDNTERLTEQVRRHARVHDQLASDVRYAGGLGWCAFDYNTHAEFGSGDRVSYHGVSDIFRIPKRAAGFYKSQCDPVEEIVLEPAFHWSYGDCDRVFSTALICSNCEELKLFIADKLVAEVKPERETYKHLKYPPFSVNIADQVRKHWGDLRIDGYIGGKKVISRSMSGKGVDQRFRMEPDDTELIADGSDATRVVMRVTDEFANDRPFATGAINLAVEGPGEIIGENPFALVGGAGAIWIRTKSSPGVIRLTGTHSVLGSTKIEIRVRPPAFDEQHSI